ncbi:hypothetical protein BDW02DRAFT_574375 [Decorospora gaudefroyi]|uniref:Uncharacterized protein n=1 Tax=Decorospora gaudefroyi TaxID=184978 RepID=A0A6A5K416_9PLEO|nr:hypothetical protein BDW02DRAFT_574375 [Decorospora gaudefroyi]
MLAARTHSAFVCLRCEAQIARRRLPVVPRRPPHVQFSASARRRRHDAEGEEEGESPPPNQQSNFSVRRVMQRLRRVRKSGDKIIRETSARLDGVKRLGGEADILVLKEVRDASSANAGGEGHEIIPLNPIPVPDIVASLQQQDTPPTPEELYQGLESLRPKNDAEVDADSNEPHYVNQATFLKLEKRLLASFTQHQLVAFFSVAKNIQQAKVYRGVIDSMKHGRPAPHLPVDLKRPIERGQWQPGTTSIKNRLPSIARNIKSMRTHKTVGKPLLVDRILRDVWNLVLLEEIEAPGELELFLRPWQITLLKAGEGETLLDRIGRARRARLEVYFQDDVIRITADKSTAEYAANDIEEALWNSATEQLDLKPYAALLADEVLPKVTKPELVSLFSQQDFNAISAFTRATIEITSKTILTVRGLDNVAVEEAKRTLLRLFPFKDSTVRTFETRKLLGAKSSMYLMPVFPEAKSLEQRYRHMKLGRMTLPIERLAEPETREGQTHEAETIAKATKRSNAALDKLVSRTSMSVGRFDAGDGTSSMKVNNWAQEAEYTLHAKIGQVLFPLDSAEPHKAGKAITASASLSPFVPYLPGLTSLLASPELSATSRLQTPSLLYEFQPDPDQPAVNKKLTAILPNLPSLRIEMRTGRKGAKPTMDKLNLSFDHRMHDVLLPDEAADLRFFRRGTLSLRNAAKNANVQQWTAAVIENIESGGRLTAPPLTIKIPKWTISGNAQTEKGTLEVTYNFSGIQFQQSISGTLFDNPVSYSTIQSGNFGAKGGTLTAHYSANEDTHLTDKTQLEQFVNKCLAMVDLVTCKSSQTVPVSKQLRPRIEDSERRLRRLGMSTAAAADGVHDGLSTSIDTDPGSQQDQDSTEAESELPLDSTLEEQSYA